MIRRISSSIVAAATMFLAGSPADARGLSLADLRIDQRVLLVSASAPNDPLLAAQRRESRRWLAAARDRDLIVVQLVGPRVIGASDAAAALRERYHLPDHGFALALVGKDGRVAFRARHPLTAAALITIIDGMPMRRAGLR